MLESHRGQYRLFLFRAAAITAHRSARYRAEARDIHGAFRENGKRTREKWAKLVIFYKFNN